MQAATGEDKQALSQAALELLRHLTRIQQHAKVQSQSPAEGLEPLPLEPPHLQELLADLSGKAFAMQSDSSLRLAQSLLRKGVLNTFKPVWKPKSGIGTGFRFRVGLGCSTHPAPCSVAGAYVSELFFACI